MLHMPTPMLMGSSVEIPTYSQFVAHLETLTSVVYKWATDGTTVTGRVVVGAETGTMAGTPWLAQARTSTTYVARFVQHALPDLATMLAIAGTEVYISIERITSAVVPGLTRNGFTSATSTSAQHARCALILWYQPGSGPMQSNPYAGTPPTSYLLPPI